MDENKTKKNNKEIEEDNLMNIDKTQEDDISETTEDGDINEIRENNDTVDSEEDNYILKLGQVIQFIAPSDVIHKKIYLIEYLDERKIKLINVDDLNTMTLKIFENEIVGIEVERINILKNPDNDGYARQNNLLPHKWISITFGGDIPQIINGEITDLENDEIQITTWPEKQLLWINFDYKGIPENLPILSILPIENPKNDIDNTDETYQEVSSDEVNEKDRLKPIDSSEKENEEQYTSTDYDDNLNEYSDSDEYDELEFTKDTNETHNKEEIFIDIKDIVIGDAMGVIQEEVVVDKANRRYTIDDQTNDLLNDLLSTIPTHEKTPKKLNKIHTDIERFKELRKNYLLFDEQGNSTIKLNDDSVNKPMTNVMLSGKNAHWVLPVTSNVHNVYDIEVSDFEIFDDINVKKVDIDTSQYMEISNQYYSNTIPDGKNKYEYFLQETNDYFKPFDVRLNKNSIISNVRINEPLYVVSDNVEDYHSHLVYDKSFYQHKFNIDKYIVGESIVYQDNLKFKSQPLKRRNITQNETYDLKGLIILPKPVIIQSKIYLPSTNMITRVNLYNNKLNISDVLHDNTQYKTHNIVESDLLKDNTVKTIDYKPYKIYSVQMSESFHYDDRDKKLTENFLNATLPNTVDIINDIAENTFVLSIEDILNITEPYQIYHDNLHYNDIDVIETILEKQIVKYKQMKSMSNDTIQTYLKHKHVGPKHTPSVFLNLLPEENEQFSKIKEIFNSLYYNVTKEDNRYEVIKNILLNDNGVLLFNAISLSEMSLFQTINIDEYMENEIKDIEASIKEKDQKNTECKNAIFLVKRYEDIDELNEDDYNVNLKADKKYYNHIDFDIGISWKENNPNIDGEQEMIEKLTEYLIQKLKVKSSTALRDAETMIYGYMKVHDGDYALLDYGDEKRYYERQNNKWILNEAYDGKTVDELNFCNMKDKCIKVKKTCNNMDVGKDIIKQRLLNEINEDFKDKLRLSIDDLKKKLVNNLNYNLSNLQSLKKINKNIYLENNNNKYQLGFLYENLEVVTSPYASLRDTILSDNDLVTKSFNINKFIELYCRQSYADEDKYWYYCVEKNIPLLPTFFAQLANGFNENKYKDTIQEICKERGVLSNDGDKYVDKYSGYYICDVELSTDEGYTEDGFKIVTKSLLEKDIADVYEESLLVSTEYKYKSELSISIKNVLDNLDKLLNISTIKEHDFIIKHISNYILENLNEKEYKRKMKKMKDKKIPPYEKQRDQLMLYSIATMYCISIQIYIPALTKGNNVDNNIKTLKNCVKSFHGYPLSSNDDMSMVKYVVCALLKMKTKQNRPYNALPKTNKSNINDVISKIATKLKDKMFVYFLELNDVKEKIKERYIWDSKQKETREIISEFFSLDSWNTFLPPLKQLRLKGMSGLGTSFETKFKNNIKQGNYEHFRESFYLYGKHMFFTFSIIESVQNVINKNELILYTNDNIYYQENSCCNENNEHTHTLDYFTNQENVITRYNEEAKKITKILKNYKQLSNPKFLFSKKDTRIVNPELSGVFSEETIYLFFIKNCKFNSGINLSQSILNICLSNESAFLASDSLKEKINILKHENRNYSSDSLKELLNIINQRNIIFIDLEIPITTGIVYFQENINVLKDKPITDSNISTIVPLLDDLIDRYDTTYTEETDNAVDNLLEHINTYNNNVLDNMLDLLKKVTRTKKIEEFYNNLLTWKLRGENLYMTMNDETDFNIHHMLKNMIINFIQIYPNILKCKSNIDLDINETIIGPPKHWGLSQKHNNDVMNFIKKEYEPFNNNFYLNDNIKPILSYVLERNKDILRILRSIPFYSNMEINTEQVYRSIFNGNTIKHITSYLFFSSIQLYIDYLDESEESINTSLQQETSAIMGERELKEKHVAELILAYTKILMNQKKLLNYSNNDILDGVNKSKTKEKFKITQNFKTMSEESRRVENIKKNLSLGEWSIGQTKAIFQYQGDEYDRSREAMEQDMLIEMKSKAVDDVSNMHDFIYNLEYVEEQMIQQRIENEEYGLHTMAPDDDDYGDMDGDEYY